MGVPMDHMKKLGGSMAEFPLKPTHWLTAQLWFVPSYGQLAGQGMALLKWRHDPYLNALAVHLVEGSDVLWRFWDVGYQETSSKFNRSS